MYTNKIKITFGILNEKESKMSPESPLHIDRQK